MKLFFLILLVTKTSGELAYIKVPFGYSLIPITCDEAFEKKVKFLENPNYETNNGENWVILKYKNYNVFGHYCIDENGKYYNGYEEKLNWELGH